MNHPHRPIRRALVALVTCVVSLLALSGTALAQKGAAPYNRYADPYVDVVSQDRNHNGIPDVDVERASARGSKWQPCGTTVSLKCLGTGDPKVHTPARIWATYQATCQEAPLTRDYAFWNWGLASGKISHRAMVDWLLATDCPQLRELDPYVQAETIVTYGYGAYLDQTVDLYGIALEVDPDQLTSVVINVVNESINSKNRYRDFKDDAMYRANGWDLGNMVPTGYEDAIDECWYDPDLPGCDELPCEKGDPYCECYVENDGYYYCEGDAGYGPPL